MVEFNKLVELINHLRGSNGCPWDRAQTIPSLKNDLLSEAMEVVKAVESGDHENLKEELGDLIWVTVMITQIAKEQGYFDVDDVLTTVMGKMVRRHPHVFDGMSAITAEEAKRIFDAAKQQEKMK
ncbi:MAG: nucleotide pyrophosphohydrolase [Candidatus Bathyarchaeota archaeon]|nr:MAG: nucleotide pyrophosphohydrolase [Candidatus Bathyarchaeota archaeon]